MVMDDETLKNTAKAEQATAWVANNLPMLLWSIYKGRLSEGFIEPQVMAITLKYLEGIRPA